MSNSESPPKWKGYSKRQKWFMGGCVAVVIACVTATATDKEWREEQAIQSMCRELVSVGSGSWREKWDWMGECNKLKR